MDCFKILADGPRLLATGSSLIPPTKF